MNEGKEPSKSNASEIIESRLSQIAKEIRRMAVLDQEMREKSLDDDSV